MFARMVLDVNIRAAVPAHYCRLNALWHGRGARARPRLSTSEFLNIVIARYAPENDVTNIYSPNQFIYGNCQSTKSTKQRKGG